MGPKSWPAPKFAKSEVLNVLSVWSDVAEDIKPGGTWLLSEDIRELPRPSDLLAGEIAFPGWTIPCDKYPWCRDKENGFPFLDIRRKGFTWLYVLLSIPEALDTLSSGLIFISAKWPVASSSLSPILEGG